MNTVLKITKVLAAGAGDLTHSAAEHGLGAELRERFAEFVRRLRRGGLIFIGIVGALIACSLLLHPIGLLLWIIALPFAGITAGLSMLWPARHAQAHSCIDSPARDLALLARTKALWLQRRVPSLPREGHTAARAAIRRLKEMAGTPSAASADPQLQGEAERLVGGHLPRLVESYCALSEHERGGSSEADRHLTEGLVAIAAELDDLCQRLSDERTRRFEIERRFIALRFPNSSGLVESR